MYTKFFGLRCLPFEDRADAQFFFSSAEREEALAAMEYEAHYGTGIGLVLGEAGTGKTLLIRALLSRLHATDHVVVITAPANGAAEITRECCKGFGVSLPSSPNESRRLNRLRRHLKQTLSAGHRSILVVDQAEHLTPTNLSEIETLADMQAEEGRLLRVILTGHHRFRLLLNQPDFVRLRQQAFKEHVLSPLTEAETKDYIRHRLQVAGAGEVDVFDAGALALIQASSGGVPRLINRACNAAMLAAYGAGESRISASIVAEVTGVVSGPAGEKPRRDEVAPCASNQNGLSSAPEYSSDAMKPVAKPLHASRSANSGEEFRDGPSRSSPQSTESTHSEPTSSQSDYSRTKAVGAVESPAELDLASSVPSPLGSFATVAESRLLSLIERAERAGANLTRSLTEAADTATQAQRKAERFLGDAEDRVREMESRLAEAASRSNESSAKIQRVERACKRAEEVESRITGFAGQLADRVDDVQARVGQLLEQVAPIEEARARLEETIGQANAACGETERDFKEWSSRMHQERETAERAIREIITAEVETSRQRLQEHVGQFERTTHGVIAAAQAETTALGQRAASTTANAEASVAAAYAKLELDTKEAVEARDQSAGRALDELRATMLSMSVDFEKRGAAFIRDTQAELAKSMSEAKAQATACGEAGSQLLTAVSRTNEVRQELESAGAAGNETREALQRCTVSANESAKNVADATAAGVHLLGRLDEATTKTERIHERTIKAASAGERTIAEANQALDRLNELQINTNKLAARLDSDSATARQVVETLAGLVTAADQKIDQLSSTHAAASHLHERLAASLVSGHQFVERADDSVHRLQGQVAELDGQSQKLSENVESLMRKCTAQIEQWYSARTAIADGEKRLQEVSEAAAHTAMELALLVEQGGRGVSSLNEGIEKSSGITQRIDAFAATLETAGGLDAELQRAADGGRSVHAELTSVIAEIGRQRESLDTATTSVRELMRRNETIAQGANEAVERVDARIASLSEADASLHSLMQTHERLEHSAAETVEHLRANLTLLKDTMDTGEPLLNDYLSRIGCADAQLAQFGERAAALERKIAEGTVGAKAIVTNAQAQAEHLNRVCTAVQKIFAGLSQSSLQAREQTEGLRRAGVEAKQQLLEFTAETEKALKTLHEWLQEALCVQSRLERALQQSPSLSETHPVEPLHRTLRRLATVERSATIDIESEPGAARAREVEPEFEHKTIPENASRADALARLIAEAKQTTPVAVSV